MDYNSILQQAYNSYLSPNQEVDFYIKKSNSPFKDDSGFDYDYRGFYKQYGNFNPQSTNGHLTDEYKKPYHPTFSIESRYYKGQPYAVDWNKEPYKSLAEYGIL